MDRRYQKCLTRRQEPALFVFTPRKWTWVDHALAVGKISLSPSLNSMEGNAVWQTAVQNMRQWTILNANVFAWNVDFVEFYYFDFSYIRDCPPHIMCQRHQSWVQNESKSKSIWESTTVHLLSCAWMEAGRRITGAESKQPQHPSRLLRAPTRVSWTSVLALCHVQSLSPSYCP